MVVTKRGKEGQATVIRSLPGYYQVETADGELIYLRGTDFRLASDMPEHAPETAVGSGERYDAVQEQRPIQEQRLVQEQRPIQEEQSRRESESPQSDLHPFSMQTEDGSSMQLEDGSGFVWIEVPQDEVADILESVRVVGGQRCFRVRYRAETHRQALRSTHWLLEAHMAEEPIRVYDGQATELSGSPHAATGPRPPQKRKEASKSDRPAQSSLPSRDRPVDQGRSPRGHGLPPGWYKLTDYGKVRGYRGPRGTGLKATTIREAWQLAAAQPGATASSLHAALSSTVLAHTCCYSI